MNKLINDIAKKLTNSRKDKQRLSIYMIVIATVITSILLLASPVEERDAHGQEDAYTDEQGDGNGDENERYEENVMEGPRHGRLLTTNDFAIEITLYEKGVPPEFRVYAYDSEELVDPRKVDIDIKLHRLGNVTDTIGFSVEQDYLKGDTVVYKPHSFEVEVKAIYGGNVYHWRYENFEGRVHISADIADKMGVKTRPIEKIVLNETRTLTGQVRTNPNLLSQVRARYPGIVQSVQRDLGDQVLRGEVLATVQSNESLQPYKVTSPISGVIVRRNLQVNESTRDNMLFVVADLSNVWIELDVFSRDMKFIRKGQSVVIESLDGLHQQVGEIKWISPLASHASQSVIARLEMSNKDRHLRPGQFVRGHVTVAEHPVDLAVRRSALQKFRDFTVIFAQFGEAYEVRMLELGQQNEEWVEVLSGVDPGIQYVTENSYLIKADIEKSGASHDH